MQYTPAVLNVAAGIGILLIGFLVRVRFPASAGLTKAAGLFIVFLGMSISA